MLFYGFMRLLNKSITTLEKKSMKTTIFLMVLVMMLTGCTGCTGCSGCSGCGGSHRDSDGSKRLSRAAYLSGKEDEASDEMMNQIMACTKEKDIEGLKKLFSKNALEKIENIDDKLEIFVDVLDVNILEYEGGSYFSEGKSSMDHDDDGGISFGHGYKLLASRYELKTDSMKYAVRFVFQNRNEEDPNEIGIAILEVMDETRYRDEDSYKISKGVTDPGIYIAAQGVPVSYAECDEEKAKEKVNANQ